MNLPDTTGIELCRSLRAAGIEIDVIAVTAVRDAAVVRSAVSLGIVQYLIKPFGFAAFAEKLAAYRDYHARVGSAVVTDQQEVDASFAALRTSRRPTSRRASLARRSTACAPPCVRCRDWGDVGDGARGLARTLACHGPPLPRAPRRHRRGRARGRYGTPGRPEVEYRRR